MKNKTKFPRRLRRPSVQGGSLLSPVCADPCAGAGLKKKEPIKKVLAIFREPGLYCSGNSKTIRIGWIEFARKELESSLRKLGKTPGFPNPSVQFRYKFVQFQAVLSSAGVRRPCADTRPLDR